MTRKSRIAKLEAKRPTVPVTFDVQIVDEITLAMRQAQREAYARGERYYIIELENEEHEQP